MTIEQAWAAGIFEGEGCISIQAPPDRNKKRLVLTVGMTDEDTVRRFHSIVGVGNVYGPFQGPGNRKPAWHWRCGRKDDIRALLELWLPLLSVRRTAKARAALAEL